MKKKKYAKAMKMREDKLIEHALLLDELVDEMFDEGMSVAEVIGMLDAKKQFIYRDAFEELEMRKALESFGETA